MPDFEDIEQEAKDHGRLIDEEVAEIEKEADKAAEWPGSRGEEDRRRAGK